MVGKTRKGKAKRYEIHDNYNRPFIVEVGSKKLAIFKQEFDRDSDKYKEPTHFKDYTFRNVWIGDDTLHFGRKLGWKPSMKGNSILAELSSGKMLFIGPSIYEFSMMPGDEPVQYSSVIGNNDVPYPYLIGKTHTYLMEESKVIPNEFLDLKKDAYVQYYAFDGNTTAKDHATNLKKKVIQKRVL